MRHTCATFLIANGAGAHELMRQLGHSSIIVTMNTYGHLLPETQRDTSERVEQWLLGRSS